MGELLIILALALIVFGPQKLPELASTLGKAIRQFRKATQDLTDQLEIDEEVKQPLRELRAALRDDPPAVRPMPNVTPAAAPAAPAPPAPPAPAVTPPIAAANQNPAAPATHQNPAAKLPPIPPPGKSEK